MAHRMEVEHLPDDIQDMLAAFLRWNVLLYPVGKEDDADLIVVLDSRESECSSNLRCHISLRLTHGTEIERAGDVNEEHNRQFTLLLKDLHIRPVQPCGHIPVDVADIVAELIFPHLGKLHTSALECRVVLSGEDILAQTAGLDLYLPYFPKNIRSIH